MEPNWIDKETARKRYGFPVGRAKDGRHAHLWRFIRQWNGAGNSPLIRSVDHAVDEDALKAAMKAKSDIRLRDELEVRRAMSKLHLKSARRVKKEKTAK